MKPGKRISVLAALGGLIVAAGVAGAGFGQGQKIEIKTLSSRADLVSGGDVLVGVSAPRAQASQIKITVNGRAAMPILTRANGDSYQLLIGGLRNGANSIAATANGATAKISVTNYPTTGPILSGPHLKPYECRTEESGLGKALDADCTAPMRFDYFYRAADRTFKPLPTGPRPADLVNTTTIEGKTVPYIVRVESGTINRTIYRIAVLDNPAASAYSGVVAQIPATWSPSPAWNGRFAVSFGGGSGTKYNQGVNQVAAPLNDLYLSRGFAHMVATELVNGLHTNGVLQGETLMMLKEHFIERYGVPKWTVGSGGSGGAIQQLVITQTYPGLLDGLQPSLSFPDSTMFTPDCGLLQVYWKKAGPGWTQAKKTAVEGYTPGTCGAWERSFVPVSMANYKPGCDLKDQSLIYDAKTNPKGARCAGQEMRANYYGRDPKTGYARKAIDNVGVQYGLKGLNEGAISVDEFLDLNDRIGGNDLDGNFIAARSVGDPIAIKGAYESGALMGGGGGLANVPIIHSRTYNDPLGDIHDRHRDLTVRARLEKALGRSDHEVIWVGPGRAPGTPAPAAEGADAPAAPAAATPPAAGRGAGRAAAAPSPWRGPTIAEQSLTVMIKWLDDLVADPAPLSTDKVVRHKPAEAVDAYFDPNGGKHAEKASWDNSTAYNKMYPVNLEPRIVAGSPVTNDVIKCQLKPVNLADYKVTFTPAQASKLKSVFATGVCDYTKRSVAWAPMKGYYRRY